jgi:hypothetical protein
MSIGLSILQYDADIANMKSKTDNLMSNDSKEFGGKLTVNNDLVMSPLFKIWPENL